ncbi:unnamed protein product [Citrullus colocynthis]|uniref:Pentatricopeptide repeat-containing protein n=1 Tax=Citrullus colocynthis TaxID=252529 RepID=A0ABP0Z598_9ROSI
MFRNHLTGIQVIDGHPAQGAKTLVLHSLQGSSRILMLRLAPNLLRRISNRATSTIHFHRFSLPTFLSHDLLQQQLLLRFIAGSASSPSLSIWRRKKEMGKEGLIVVKELKRLQSNFIRLDRFISSHVSRLLKSDLVAVLVELQRQNQVFLCMKLYNVVRKEVWYRPDMFFYRDMLMMLAKNKRVEETKQVWEDLKKEGVLFDQHTFGDIIRAYLDNAMPSEAMDIYREMRESPDRPLSLPFRVILKGLIPYPELREQIKDDFLELFPDMIVYDPPEDLFDEDEDRRKSEDH